MKIKNLLFFVMVLFFGVSCSCSSQAKAIYEPSLIPSVSIEPKDSVITQKPTLTSTPIPIPIPIPTFVVEKGAENLVGKYQALSQAQADSVAESLGYVTYASSSNMCGPLSASILKDMGILPIYIENKSLWLLNLNNDEGFKKLGKIFDPENFDYFVSSQDVVSSGISLEAGDWLYLFGGSFDHMLVIDRVDAGKVYSINNNQVGEKGFIIDEFLMYNPKDQSGLFKDWLSSERRDLGTTGEGGFVLVRRKGIVKFEYPPSHFTNTISFIEDSPFQWNVYLKEVGQKTVVFEWNPGQAIHPASMIKPIISAAVLDSITLENIQKGYAGRSFAQLTHASVVLSEEVATEELLQYMRERQLFDRLEKWDLNDTSLSPRQSTVEDIGEFLEDLYVGNILPDPEREYLLSLMGEFTQSDTLRLGAIPDVKVYNKRGTITDEFLTLGDAGILVGKDKVYVFVINVTPNVKGSSYLELEELLQELILIIAEEGGVK